MTLITAPQNPIPKYRPASLISATRPNGKLYKAQKPPVAHLLYEDNEVVRVLVLRTDDYLHARDLATFELLSLGDTALMPVTPRFGWWRQSIRENQPWFVEDDVHGSPGYLFTEIVERTS